MADPSQALECGVLGRGQIASRCPAPKGRPEGRLPIHVWTRACHGGGGANSYPHASTPACLSRLLTAAFLLGAASAPAASSARAGHHKMERIHTRLAPGRSVRPRRINSGQRSRPWPPLGCNRPTVLPRLATVL